MTKLVRQSAGWVIMRQPPPMGPPLPPIYPELRPIEAVKTHGPRVHWHGDGEPPTDLTWSQGMPGDRHNWQSHIARKKAEDDHHGVNTEEIHRHQDFAKYVFATVAKVDAWYQHDHATAWARSSGAVREDKRLAHIAKRSCHDGIAQEGPHWHPWRVKGPGAMAKRIDVHPLAVPLLNRAQVVYFVIEGCIKADAVLADGGAVFSVPSVSLWDCDELQRFAAEYLLDRIVVIVPDADWTDKNAVINQARLCQAQLFRLGVLDVHIAAPPPTFGEKDTKGVDDFIGAGGHLEDLLVVDSEVPAGLHDYLAARTTRRDQTRRDEGVLWGLSAYTGPTGTLQAPLATVARVIGTHPMAVSRAVRSLERIGALTIDGDLSAKRGWFSHKWDWKERPSITLIPELRSSERPPQRLEELLTSIPVRISIRSTV
ncbi:MAG: hypothetical protein WBW80_23145 [Acidimicrobiales bacterium]